MPMPPPASAATRRSAERRRGADADLSRRPVKDRHDLPVGTRAPAEGQRFARRKRSEADAALAWAIRAYVHADAFRAPLHSIRLRRRLDACRSGALPVLVSEESIAISRTGFWSNQGASPVQFAARVARLARGLDPALSPMRIILGIRRQDQWLASRYADSAREVAGFSQADFDRRAAAIAAMPEGTETGPLAWLDYAATQRTLAAAFGADNVLVLPTERIKAAPVEAVARLGDFLGGVRLPAEQEAREFIGQTNNRRSRGENHWRMRGGGDLRLSPELSAALQARYAASNAALSRLIPLDF